MLRLRALALSCLLLAPPRGEGGDHALAQALASVDARSILGDVRVLSDESLGGRATPSPGLRSAARYLAARARAIGLVPAGRQGFLAPYEECAAELDLARTAASFRPADGAELGLAFGHDYAFLPSGLAPLALEGELVSVGDASKSALRGLDLAGRVALVRGAREESWVRRSERLHEAGVAGIVLAPDGPAGGAAHESHARRMLAQSGRRMLRNEVDAEPTVLLTPGGAARLGLRAEAWPAPGAVLGRWQEERALAGEDQAGVENVVALWRGSDPALAHEVLLVSAHYDHLGDEDGVVFPGADDNATGCAALLALGEALARHRPLRRSVALVWLAGEEEGLRGSWAWANDPTLPAGLVAVADVNLDMLGRNAPEELLVTPSRAHPAHNPVVAALEAAAAAEGFDPLAPDDGSWDRSDHSSFARVLGIPVAGLTSGEHEDYHAPGDTWERIDADKVARATRLVLRSLSALDAVPLGVEAPASR